MADPVGTYRAGKFCQLASLELGGLESELRSDTHVALHRSSWCRLEQAITCGLDRRLTTDFHRLQSPGEFRVGRNVPFV
jgi:hypothetical protein